MPAFANISPEQVHALVNYLVYGQKEMPSPSEPAPNIKYRFTGYKRFLTPKAILRSRLPGEIQTIYVPCRYSPSWSR